MDEKLTNNNNDLNNNGVPDWYESRIDDQTSFPEGDLGHAYTSEEKIAAKIPNYKDYKWYQNPAMEGHPGTEYFYTLGEKLENKIESGEITPDELPEGSDIQKEAEQLYDTNPNNDEVNNEVVSKADFDKMNIDEIEQRDAESITKDKPYMAIAEDMGLEEEDLFYFEQPDFIENLTPEQIEEVKNEPDKQKKIDLLKMFSVHLEDENNEIPNSIGDGQQFGDANIGNSEVSSKTPNNLVDNPLVTSQVRQVGSFLGGGAGGGGISAGSISNFDFDDKTDNTTSEAGRGQSTDIEVSERDANTASLNSANSLEHLDNSLDELGFKDTEHNKEIKSNEQADLPNGEFHEKDKESFELKLPENPNNNDIISYLEKDSKNWENGDSKSKYLPFRFFIKDDELYGTVIGHGRPEKIEDFMKHEILAKGKISNIIRGK